MVINPNGFGDSLFSEGGGWSETLGTGGGGDAEGVYT